MIKVSAITLGCKVNQAETEEIFYRLGLIGFCRVPPNAEADLVLVNTCTVTNEADKQSHQVVRRALRRGCPVIVTGCSVSIGVESFRALGAIAIPDKALIRGTIEAMFSGGPFDQTSTNPLRTRGFLKVTEGCTNHCSYCIVPQARGPEKSVPLERLIEQVRGFEEDGIPEIVINGTRLGAYGLDRASEKKLLLPELLERLFEAAPSVTRWRLSSIEPLDLTPPIAELFKQEKICPNLHLPLQSGSDRILKKMNRRYALPAFERSVQTLREARSDLTLSTDLIVGFPEETEEDFASTLEAVEKYRFAGVHAFPYSPRPGTPAADWQRVPPPVISERLGRLLEASTRIRQAWLESWVGREAEVVVERVKDPLKRTGLTPHYLRVDFEDEEARQGEKIRVKILASEGEGAVGERVISDQ